MIETQASRETTTTKLHAAAFNMHSYPTENVQEKESLSDHIYRLFGGNSFVSVYYKLFVSRGKIGCTLISLNSANRTTEWNKKKTVTVKRRGRPPLPPPRFFLVFFGRLAVILKL